MSGRAAALGLHHPGPARRALWWALGGREPADRHRRLPRGAGLLAGVPRRRVGGACALCFPGTAPSYQRDVLCARAYPRGVRDDLDPRGVGYAGFMHNRDAWLRQVHEVVADGRDLWLVGHSLGAADASEMMAFVTERLPQHAQQVHLLSIYGPGLRRVTLEALAPLRARIFRKTHRLDVTGWCGAGHPAALVCRTHDCIGTRLVPFQVPHAVPQTAMRRLRGEAPRHRLRDEEACYHRLNVAEALRLAASWLCWRRLAA